MQTPLELGQPNSPTEAKATQPIPAPPEQVQVAALQILEKEGLVVAKVPPVRIGDMSTAGLVTYDFIGDVNKLNATDRILMENAGFTFTTVAEAPKGGFTPTVGVGPDAVTVGFSNLGLILGAPQELSGGLREEASAAKLKGNSLEAAAKFTAANIIDAGEIMGIAAVGSAVAPISFAGVLGAAGVNVAISEGFSYAFTGKPLTAKEVVRSALVGEVFAVGGAGVQAVAAQSFPKLVGSIYGRAAVNAAVGGVGGLALSGGDIKAGAEGALFGGISH